MTKFGRWLHWQLHSPLRILLSCIAFAGLSLLFNGGLLNLYSLHRDHRQMYQRIDEVRGQILDLDMQIKRSKDPAYIEHQALDRYDLVEENDLVFVFADQ